MPSSSQHAHTPESASNLRLFQSDGTWLAWGDGEDDGKTLHEAKEHIEDRLLSALNATNLMVLLGSGASLAAKNPDGDQAPSMSDLWDYTQLKVGNDKFDKVVQNVGGRADRKDIEHLLSLCKMTVELQAAQAARNTEDGKNAVESKSTDPLTSDATDTDGDQTVVESKSTELFPPDATDTRGDQTAVENKNLDDLVAFIQDAEKAILERVDFVSESTDLTSHKQFLRRLAKRSAEKARVKIFTTNYDRCIEEAAAAHNLVVIDGFSHSAVQHFNRDHFQQDIVRRSASSTQADYVDGVFHLYKLHGSMDWWRRKSDGVVIRQLSSDSNYEPVLIYPRSSKYQEAFAPPYLDMFAAWQSALREPDTTLIVSGFGFADDHISAPIWSALESNLSIHIILCDPCFVPIDELNSAGEGGGPHKIDKTSDSLNDYQKRILNLVCKGDNRITILNGRFSDLALALPEIMGETDRRRLEERLESIRSQENAHG